MVITSILRLLPSSPLLLGCPFERTHLPRLNLVNQLLSNVNPSVCVAESVRADVPLGSRFQLLRLPPGQLVQVLGSDLCATNLKVHARPDLGQFDSRRLLSRLLQLDFVGPHQDLHVLGDGEANHVLNALQSNTFDLQKCWDVLNKLDFISFRTGFNSTYRLPVEGVHEQALKSPQLLRLRPLGPVEDQAGFAVRGDFLVLEVRQSFIAGHPQLDHVQEFVFEEASQHQVIGSFLGRGAEHKQVAFAADNQVLQFHVVLKRSQVVATRQGLGQRLLQVVQIFQSATNLAGTLASFQEERVLGRLN